MSQHRQATDPGPSRLAVVSVFVSAATAAITATWTMAGSGNDPRYTAGGAMGFFLAVALTIRFSELMADRESARRRIERAERAASRYEIRYERDPVEAYSERFARELVETVGLPDPVATQPQEPPGQPEDYVDPLDLTRPYVLVLRPEDATTQAMPRVDV